MFNKKMFVNFLIIIIFLFAFAADQYTKNIFDLSLYEYIIYSGKITEKEREYLEWKKTLLYTSDKNAPPFSFVDKNNGQYKGLVTYR